MSETNGNGGIHLLTNGRAPMNKSGDLVTRKQVETFVTEFTETVVLPKMIEIVESYMRQFPELVASMLEMGFAANGLTFKGPQGPSGAGGHTSASAVADASAAPTTAMDAPHAGPSAAATESTLSDAADERAVDP